MDLGRVEAHLQLADGLLALLEAGHGGAVGGVHHLYQHHYFVLVLADGLEAQEEVLPELLKVVGLGPVQYLDVLT